MSIFSSGEYWKRVSLADAKYRVNLTEDFLNGQLARYYSDAKAEILQEIEAFYERYAEEAGISLAQAKRLIKAAEFKGIDFRKLAKQAAFNNDAEGLDLLERLSLKGRISRLDNLNLQIDGILSRLYDKEQISVYEYLADTYTNSYYRSVYNVNRFLGVRTAFDVIDEKVITEAVNRSWSKKHFSKTIWGHREDFSEDLRSVIPKHLIKGDGIDKMSRDLSKRCDVAFSKAKTLVRTETARIHNDATLDAYKSEAGIEKYKFLATLDFKTSVECQNLDGAVLDVAFAQTGVNYPPIHPNCRSTITPEIDSDFIGERLAKDANGNYYYVSADMNYHEWYNSLPEKTRQKMELERKKARNLYSDKKQFESYKDAFKNSDIKLPKDFAGFQKIKYGGGDWEKYKSEFRAINADEKQMEGFKSVLGSASATGSKVPESLAEFRNLKYNRPEEFKRLKRTYDNEIKTVRFRRKLDSGDINLKIREQKQKEHILGTKQWYDRVRNEVEKGEPLANAFYKEVDIQKLVNENAGKGQIKFKGSDAFPREYFNSDKDVGIAFRDNDGKYVKSKRVAVHYSSRGTHAYPVPEFPSRRINDD